MSPAEPLARSTPGRATDVLIAGSGMLTGLALTGLSPVLPRIAADLGRGDGASDYRIGMLVSVVGLSIMVSAPASAYLARRFRCADVLIAAFACFAVAALASSLAPSLPWLIAARFAQGVGVAIGVTTLLAIAGMHYPAIRRDRLLGLHMGLSALALMVLLPLAGALGDHDWRLTPLIGLLALPHLALAIAARRQLGFRLEASPGRSGVMTRAEREQAALCGLTALLIGVALYSLPAFLPFKMVAIGHGSGKAIGLITVVGATTSALASLGYGTVTSRLSGRGVYLLALPCSIAGALAGAAAGSVWELVAGQLVGGLGSGLLVAHIYGDCSERLRPEARAVGAGIVKASSFAGLFVGPIILQAIVARSAIGGAFVGIAIAYLLALVVACLGRGRATSRTIGNASSG